MRRSTLLAGLVASVLLTTACAGTGAPPPAPPATPPAGAGQLDPAAFEDAVEDEGTFTLNVHTPDAGSIPGTDAAIPYDSVGERAAELPAERTTPLAVYCRSGSMSARAVPALRALGYTDVVELRGGMDAWTASGRSLLPPGE